MHSRFIPPMPVSQVFPASEAERLSFRVPSARMFLSPDENHRAKSMSFRRASLRGIRFFPAPPQIGGRAAFRKQSKGPASPVLLQESLDEARPCPVSSILMLSFFSGLFSDFAFPRANLTARVDLLPYGEAGGQRSRRLCERFGTPFSDTPLCKFSLCIKSRGTVAPFPRPHACIVFPCPARHVGQ